MRVLGVLIAVSTFAVVAGCERQGQSEIDPAVAAELRLLDSLILAGAMAPAAQPVVSDVELGLVEPAPVEPVAVPVATREPAPQARPRATRTSSSGSTARSSSPAPAPAPQPRVVTVKHTKRDAAIGAGAGAVIGATVAGRGNRVKGAVIGGVVGGVAGAVIGNNVDKSTRIEH